MHRSGSTTRASDECFVVGATVVASATPPSAGGQVRRSSSMGVLPRPAELLLLLPKYDPQSSIAKKEAARSRSAEAAVHVIPFVLVACALVLWFFSSSPSTGLESMTIDGYRNDVHSLLADGVPSAEL